MDQEELHTQILMRDYLERQELKASAIATNHCVDMESDELDVMYMLPSGAAGRETGADEPCIGELV